MKPITISQVFALANSNVNSKKHRPQQQQGAVI